jgi:hypothetical protein
MKKRAHGLIGFRIALTLMALLLLLAALACVSIFFPYVPSQNAQSFCYFVIPPALISSFVAWRIYLYCKLKRQHRLYEMRLDSPLGTYSSLIIFAFLLGLCALEIPAIATDLFASRRVDLSVRIDKLSGFRADHGHWVWVYFNGGTDKFLWVWSDHLIAHATSGSCIALHAREWALGFYIDSISASSRCS